MRKMGRRGFPIRLRMVPGAMEKSLERQVTMASHYSTDWYADCFSDNDRGYSPCSHRNVVVDTSGGRRFVESEVTDDILVRALCLDCGQFLTESEIRGTWRGELYEIESNFQLEDEYENE
jgi:hypothetical protein